MPIIKWFKVRYYCETCMEYFYEDQQTTVALPAQCPNAHTVEVLRDLVVLKEWIEYS